MDKSLTELDIMLDGLETALPQMIEDHADDGGLWAAFAGKADAIEDVAGEHPQPCPIEDRLHAGEPRPPKARAAQNLGRNLRDIRRVALV